MNTPLTIYKASAGSGKTFTLAVNYIKILIDNPHSYRNILAVTFTNKATEEMKLRILSQLYGIWKLLPDSKAYLDRITAELDITAEHASQQAGIALIHLLHNYNYFRVETIDAFFQSVLRNLARELELTANLHVGLNDLQVEQQAVDELIESLSTTSKVLGWIMSYIKQNISDDKNWNVIGQIKRFGENIFKDVYKTNYKQLHEVVSNDKVFEQYVNKIRKVKTQAEEQLKNIAVRFEQLLAENGLAIDDFSNKEKGVCGYFIKLKRGTYDDEELLKARVLAALDDPNAWVSKKEQTNGSRTLDVVNRVLFDYLNEAEKIRQRQARLHKSAVLTLRNLDQLRLLERIETKVRQLNTDANRFLLSDTQTLLHALVDDNDTPFIFEKAGTQIEHIMIDEFQDTSTVQWQNFKVLLNECMSHKGSQSLIVGDVKQSIYRWRSGDWRLLNDIENQFASSAFPFAVESMTVNYRSARNIVNFNNAFFCTAAAIEHAAIEQENAGEAQQMKTAYADVAQEVPQQRKEEGRVEVKLFAEEDAEERMLVQICDTVQQLLQEGAREKDIAILVRSNDNIAQIADCMMRRLPQVRLVSDEGFKLRASLAVNIIVNALALLVRPADRLLAAILAKAYQVHILKKTFEDAAIFTRGADPMEMLPKEFCKQRDELASLPIYTAAERIYAMFGLDALPQQSAYVCTFYDHLRRFLSENPADIEAVLSEWETNMNDKAIQSDEPDGVRLLTIHKSKGLEFAHTIVPFCDWMVEKTGATLWCTPTEAPFNELPLVPVNLSPRQMKGSVYEADYLHEHLQNRVDNLNLLYVAFTRAGNNLFVYGKQGKSNSRAFLVEQCLEKMSDVLQQSKLETHDNGDLYFTFGTLLVDKKAASEGASPDVLQNVFNTVAKPLQLDIKVYDSRAKFRQSSSSADFVSGEDENAEKTSYIRLGSVLHQLFAKIRTIDDVPRVLKQMEFDGVLYDDKITRESLQELLAKRFENARVKEWFSPDWQVFNECTILVSDPITGEVTEHRPDRVLTDGKNTQVIDFKFGKPRPEHREQIHRYMQLLVDMGHTNVKGSLWYVYSNEIEDFSVSSSSTLQ